MSLSGAAVLNSRFFEAPVFRFDIGSRLTFFLPTFMKHSFTQVSWEVEL